jgi:primase-polymerase (primpol)-like protein
VNYEPGEKIPLDPHTGRYASTTDSLTWGTFEEAVRRAEEHGLGIGFVFSSGDPFVGVDLDKCRNAETGEVEQWAQEIIEELDSYTEVSVSGTGVHIIAKGKPPASISKTLSEFGGKIEMYSQERFFTVTGNVMGVDA